MINGFWLCVYNFHNVIDSDKVALSNLNRQIIATHSSIGKYKVDVMKERILDINPDVQAKEAGVPVISCMGAGNKLDPTAFEVADISKTSVCPLARVMRQECKKRGLKDVKVVYSKEKPQGSGNDAPASCAFVPSVAGLVIASEVIKDLIAKDLVAKEK